MTVADRIQQRVGDRNRELVTEALIEAGLGVVFTILTFGVLFWLVWIFGYYTTHWIGLRSWQLAAIVTAVFLVVSFISAWRRVDPVAGVEPMSDEQLWLVVVSIGSGYPLVFEPRLATAGAAAVLIGGPAALFGALGTWCHQLDASPVLVEEAAALLDSCQNEPAIDDLESPRAALLLRRLALIKVVPRDDPNRLALTDAGRLVLWDDASGPSPSPPTRRTR